MKLVKSFNTNKISSEIIMDYIDLENNDMSYEVLELLIKVLEENNKKLVDNYS